MATGYADIDTADPADAADAASAEPSSSCRLGEQADDSPPPGPTLPPHEPSPSSASSNPPFSAAGPPPESSSMSRTRTTSFPISFPPIFFQRSKVPSASLAPSTAEGRPVRITDPADTPHTSALQKLNSKYPSAIRRHGYTPEAPGAQSSTYSQPVLVRTYSGPPPSQGSRSTRSRQYRPPSSGRAVSRRVPLPSASTPGSGGPGRPIQPTVSGVGVGTTSSIGTGVDRDSTDRPLENSVYGVSMPRPYKPKKPAASSSSKLPLSWPWQSSRQEPGEPKLPPLDAFSFKSFMADLEVRGGDNDIGADLDRIAEICARSRYSLSNQYEVHVAPHGSGASFMSAGGPSPSSAPRRKGHSRSRSHGHGAGGPTLQAITSDDENPSRSQPRRRNPGKRRNTAYGTLETIMSSSRSSEEDKSKKKSASELVGEVRGRAAKKAWDNLASASTSTGNGADPSSSTDPHPDPTTTNTTTIADPAKLARKKSASFATAIIDSSKTTTAATITTSASSSRRHNKKPPSLSTPSALLSEPARPQTSNSHLGVRTTPAPPATLPLLPARSQPQSQPRSRQPTASVSAAAGSGGGAGSVGSGWAGWMPWRGGLAAGGELPPPHQQPQQGSHAEGSLRLLLRAGSSAGSTAGGEAGG